MKWAWAAREYSEDTAKAIDEEVKKLIDHLYEETRQLLEANRDRVDAVAKALLRYENAGQLGCGPPDEGRGAHQADGRRSSGEGAQPPGGR